MKLKIIICCLFICFILAKIHAADRLNRIRDLRDRGYASEFPRHGLLLIFWFAQSVHIDNNGIMHMDHVNLQFFRVFNNHERILPANRNYRYMGNLNRPISRRLPYYVRYNYEHSGVRSRNVDRLVISRVGWQITGVFVTSHHDNSNAFDERQTFEITNQLINEIRLHYNQNQVWFFLLTLNFGNRLNFREYRPRRNHRRGRRHQKRMIEKECDTNEELTLHIESSENGLAKITWDEIPDDLLKMTEYIGLYKDADSENALMKVTSPITKSGEFATTIPLNPGLQIRFIHYNTSIGITNHTAILNGSEFDEANGVMSTELKGYNASLLLYTKDGHACARLYAEKSFARTPFQSSWVGFYTSEKDEYDKDKERVFFTNFTQNLNETKDFDYDIFEHQSNLHIRPGMQARFMLNGDKGSEKARTVPWEADESENV